MDVGAWLRQLGLGQYEQAFRDNAVDEDVLPRLTADDLKELGVAAIGHRRRLLDALAALSAAAGSRAAPAPPEPAGERRQVTVLFADLAGYTALSRRLDAEEVHALLERFFACADRLVAEHGGRVDKHVGDCVMAVFGAPLAHGNDTERAVRAALAIRDAMPGLAAETRQDLAVHVGVAGGQVMASGTGSAAHREYTVTGDSVNLAARLTEAAHRGEVLVSEAVRLALGDRLDCADVGELTVKGFAAPVRGWRLNGLRPSSGSMRRPLVGRHAELAQFRAILAETVEGGRGRAVLVRGEAGIGKTRLVEELEDAAASAGLAYHAGLVLDFGAGTGRDAIRALVRGMVGLDLADGAEAARAAAAAALAQGLVDDADAVFLHDLLDLPQPVGLRALYDAMDNASRNRGKRLTVARLVERASERAPRLLVVEDVHWADRLTLAHLAALAATVAACPAILTMTTRVDGDPLDQAWRAEAGCPLHVIDLGPLDAAEARTLAEPFLAANAALAEHCVERAAGNPLFLEQLLRHAEEGAGVAVPGSVRSLVQARLDRLAAPDKAALQAASVLGQRFEGAVLGHMVERPDYLPDRLVAHMLLRPTAEGYLFAHALIRDAVYDSLLRGRRRDLHRRAAAWFAERDPGLHAEHLDRAEAAEAPAAYLVAARAQAAGYRYEAALRLARRGLELATIPTERSALALIEGDILHDLGAMPEALAAYDRALAAAAEEADRCRAWIGLAAVKRVTEDLDGALADLERAGQAAARLHLLEEAARVHCLRGNLCFPSGDVAGCLREHGLALEIARRAGAPELEAAALGGLGDAEYVRGRMMSAHDRLCACVELCRRHGLGRIEVANAAQIAHTLLYFRPQGEAVARALSAAEAATHVGHLRAALNARAAAVLGLLNLAELDGCAGQVAEAQALVRRLGAWRFEASSLRSLGRIALCRGRTGEAETLLREAVATCRRTGITFEGPRTLSALALAVADPRERLALLAEGEALIRDGCVGHNPLFFYPDAIEVCLELGEFGEAERHAAALEDCTRPEPLACAAFHVARGRTLAALGRGARTKGSTAELRRLRDEGERLGLRLALPRIATALRGA